ncbi:hypothetical protein [Nocardia asteroides]|uniref:hypothetical protein n=1 Tax=Nocardia asteroides TaxID=1824 RepID=UPI001E409E1F|nr:hypothetical protein [Nocardia asteroides]UGT63419.1 hypothetical protein LTT61_08955 [Nocardia asteroides]
MEHVEDGAESIGAMLSDIAESLREVSRKLDLVAARVDVPLPVPMPADDRDVGTRLATIEAWAFRTDRDVADLGRRLDTLQSVADAPGTGRRHAPEPGGRRALESDAVPSGRRSAEDGESSGPRAGGAEPSVSTGPRPGGAEPSVSTGRRAAPDVARPEGEGSGLPARRRAADSAVEPGRQNGTSAHRAADAAPSSGDTAVPRRRAAENGRADGAGSPGVDPAATGRRAAETNGSGESGDIPRRRRAAEESATDTSGSGRRAAEPTRAENTAAERPAAAYGPPRGGTQPAAGPEAPSEPAAPRVPRPRYAAGSTRQRIAEARAESAGRAPADQGEPSAPGHSADRAEPAGGARRSADRSELSAPATHSADQGEPPRRAAEPGEHGIPSRLSAPAEPEPAAPTTDDEPAGPNLRAAVEARRASGRLPQRGPAPSPTPPSVTTTNQAPPTPERTDLTGPDEPARWSGPRRNGSSLGLGETVAAAYDQGLRDGFTGQQDGYRQPPAAGYPLEEPGDDFAPFADRQTPDAHTEQVGRPGLTSGAVERPGNGQGDRPAYDAAVDRSSYGDFGNGFTGATAEETAHADKVQAMLDELKRTAAAMPFGPPTGEHPDQR